MSIGPQSKVHSNMRFVDKQPSKNFLLGGAGKDVGPFEEPL